MPTVFLNGRFLEESEAAVSTRDTGFLHAAGVFTTVRAYPRPGGGPHVFRFDRHLARLRASCAALSIPLQQTDEQLREIAEALLDRNSLTGARLRLTVTRGHAREAAGGQLSLEPTVLFTAQEYEPYPAELYARGVTAVVIDEQKLNPYDMQAGHKTLNYFSRLSALRSATQRGAAEALWFDVHNHLQSGSISNVFLVKAGKLRTPATRAELTQEAANSASAVLPGIARQTVLELAAAAGVGVEFAVLTITDLLDADEAFVTNSLMQVLPVCRVERRAIGDDRPGAVTRRLMAAYDAEVRSQVGGEST